MIYLVGDTHGVMDIQKVVDFFETEQLLHHLTKNDYLIILGDAGICWDDGEKDEWIREVLQELPVTTLWLDGNHENFPLINEYPVVNWKGGKVHQIAQDILHLMRGFCYEIEGKVFWVFGGGNSIDKMNRVEGFTWWKEEMPSKDEYDRGEENLRLKNYNVDYILTHTVPESIVRNITKHIISGEEELQKYLQNVMEKTKFKKWYFGHWHCDIVILDKFHGLYEEVELLSELEGF